MHRGPSRAPSLPLALAVLRSPSLPLSDLMRAPSLTSSLKALYGTSFSCRPRLPSDVPFPARVIRSPQRRQWQRKNRFMHRHLQPRPTPIHKPAFMWMAIRQKSGGGGRPKKKIYHRAPELDRVMELQKKPSLILQLKSIIQSQKHQSILLRDLEKHVGFVQKWNFMAVIERYPSIFHAGGGNREPPFVCLTEKARKIASGEAEARALMEPILVNSLRKLLMLSVECCVPLETIEFVGPELGLPLDFKTSLIPKYPHFFSVREVNGRACLVLENWDSSLAVTARETRLAEEGISKPAGYQKKVKISKDGNYPGPYAFRVNFPAGFRPNVGYLEQFEKWQKMEFPSPYLNARRFDIADPKARKRVVGVLHELLSLTMEKRMTSTQLDAFHSEYLLPSKLLLCLIKHQGIFYLTNKGVRSTVFLKEAYHDSNLIDKCPLLQFNDKFVALSGRGNIDICYTKNSLHTAV
ncbi:protein WHAT'S THIS FACTOR 1 homolog, chloroplastic isoform X2 [Prosopis cineraria]|nr:protein WHAT'S THIS FACTOR 1 homolog, chloroplastic isoform X2 [Prosopis cineraria]XP_054813806.1 protein WHAT'S THIS FACTOR 1 homolog, chloroplastic isoform X2 [Prosopis cineraria]